jgi:hypothetical protein
MLARLPVILTAGAFLAVAASPTPDAGPGRADGSGGEGSGSCGAAGYPWGYDIACQSGGSSGGSPARHGSAATGGSPAGGAGAAAGGSPAGGSGCGMYPIAGDPKAMLQLCPGAPPVLARIVGGPAGAPAPAVTPQELLAWARDELALPLPDVQTDRARTSGGVVGIPEWFWVPAAQWKPVRARVAVGAVWAQVTAVPQALQVQPGDGAAGAGISCDGPGAAPRKGASLTATTPGSCTHLYTESSDGLPGNAYHVTVTMTWQATWAGSGGAGGALPALGRADAFTLPVGEGQALNTNPGA